MKGIAGEGRLAWKALEREDILNAKRAARDEARSAEGKRKRFEATRQRMVNELDGIWPGHPYGMDSPVCNRLSQVDAAYIAGLVDGEGCISSSYAPAKPLSYCRVYGAIELHVTVSSTTPVLLDWLEEVTGIRRRENTTQSKNPNANPAFQWRATSTGASTFLVQIKQYLRLKRPQAELLIKVHQQILDSKQPTTRYPFGRFVADLFREMNARGPARHRVEAVWSDTE